MNKNALAFVTACESKFGSEAIVSREDINRVVSESGVPYPYWLVTKSDFRADRGQYRVPASGITVKQNATEKTPEMVDYGQVVSLRQPKLVDESDAAIPAKGTATRNSKPAPTVDTVAPTASVGTTIQ